VNQIKTPKLSFLETMARHAGSILLSGFRHDYQVFKKGEIDLVTEIDRLSETYLVSEVRRYYPDHSIVAEEGEKIVGEDCCVWYIDPLDGTINFAHGIPIFSVSIAYAEECKVRLGVVYDPLRDECFSAELGKGAWLNGQPIQVSKTRELDQSLLVTGFPYDIRNNPENNLDLFARFALVSQGVRRLGSAALDLCSIACGRFDGYWELSLESWDMAAGTLIAHEAGARVTNLKGEPELFTPPYSLIAATPAIYPSMFSLIKNARS